MSPLRVSYIEMHGTGTQVGDATEISSVLESFAPDSGQYRRPDNERIFLGSAKANVGHGGAVTGVTSLAKVLLMFRHNTIPPHCGIKTRISRKFPHNLVERGVRIVDKPIAWERSSQRPRRALVNDFSAAGGNTALLLEDAPHESFGDEIDPRSTHLVAVSAKTATSLLANAQDLLSFLRSTHIAPLSLSSLSYTTTVRRVHHPHRISVSGSTIDEIASGLVNAMELDIGRTRPISEPGIIFAFTGQGSHYIGPGKDLFDRISSFRGDLRRFD